MKPKHKRLIIVVVSLVSIFTGVFTLLDTFRDNLIYFYPPKDIVTIQANEPQRFAKILRKQIRVGGMIKEHTYKKSGTMDHTFTITDREDDLNIKYTGLLPPMFREGQGVVAQGMLMLESDASSRAKSRDLDPSTPLRSAQDDSKTKYQVPSTKYYFKATNLLTKHDEKYMPPEISRSIGKTK